MMSEQHILHRFDEELDKLRSRLIKMGSIVQQQVEFSIKALISNNHELAKVIIENDDKVDKFDIKIDKQCMRIFALHQPVAMDLRLVMSAIKINDSMELIGDVCVDIAKSIVGIQAMPMKIEITKLADMGELSKNMLVKVLDSFIYSDVELAKEAILIRGEVSKLFYENFNILVNFLKENSILAEYGSYLHDVNRNIKFIADLALSIAQEVVFLVDAKIVKHKQITEPEINIT